MSITLDLLPIDEAGQIPPKAQAVIPMSRAACPVLRRIAATIIDRGVQATIEHTFRDRQGQVISLADVQSPISDIDGLVLRARPLGASSTSPILEVTGTILEGSDGLVTATVPQEVAANHGIYELSWGITYNSKLAYISSGLLSVERTLFGENLGTAALDGPPTIDEIRMSLWDSDPAENLLLNDVEFSDAQIVQAVLRPIQYFNETNPPINQIATVSHFPYRGQWLEAVGGYLYEMAGNFYSRNYLPGSAGGVDVQDLNKAAEYRQVAAMRLQSWRDFVLKKKVELNLAACYGTFGSTYGGWG